MKNLQQKIWIIASLVVASFIVFSTPAYADDKAAGAPIISFTPSWPQLIQFALAIVLPLLVAIVTKRTQSGRTRGILLALLTLISTVLTSLLGAFNGVPVELFSAGLTAIMSFIISVGFYFGLWGAKGPTGESISSKLIEDVGRQTTASEAYIASQTKGSDY